MVAICRCVPLVGECVQESVSELPGLRFARGARQYLTPTEHCCEGGCCVCSCMACCAVSWQHMRLAAGCGNGSLRRGGAAPGDAVGGAVRPQPPRGRCAGGRSLFHAIAAKELLYCLTCAAAVTLHSGMPAYWHGSGTMSKTFHLQSTVLRWASDPKHRSSAPARHPPLILLFPEAPATDSLKPCRRPGRGGERGVGRERGVGGGQRGPGGSAHRVRARGCRALLGGPGCAGRAGRLWRSALRVRRAPQCRFRVRFG